MVRFILHTHIDKQKWDACIGNAPQKIIYAYSWYLDAACEKWDALVLDNYRAVIPLPCRQKFGISYIYTPFFIQQLGLIGNLNAGEDISTCFEYLPRRFRWIDYNCNVHNVVDTNKDYKLNRNHHLPLTSSIEQLRKGYTYNLRRNLRKASQHHVEVATNVEPAAIIALFRADKGKKLEKLNDEAYQRFEHILENCRANAAPVTSLGALMQGELIAGAIFISNRNHHVFLFSGNTSKGKECGALPFLLDHFIALHARSEGVLDFEGSNIDTLAKFYKSFGSEEILYASMHVSKLPRAINQVKRWFSALKR